MQITILMQLEFFGRLVLAGLCGAAIGCERKNRLKEAGVRTHLIVALASALLMIISKYGFFDILTLTVIKLDPSRIASGIITGVSFLGAGTIFIRKQTINGLTTAAGVWATAGVGMAIGAGMYPIGIAATLLIVFSQIILHQNRHLLKFPKAEQILLEIEDSGQSIKDLQKKLAENQIEILNIRVQKIDQKRLEVDILVRLPERFSLANLLNLFEENSYITTVEI